MSKSVSRKISIYLKIDENSIKDYFNPHDPSRLDSRQLAPDFQAYLTASIACAAKNTEIDYKVFCSESGSMRFMVAPLMRAIHRHFKIKKILKEKAFQKFKKKNYLFLMMGIAMVVFCQAVLPDLFGQGQKMYTMFSTAIDVCSFLLLWIPIERLLFNRDAYLEEIVLFEKMQVGSVHMIESEEELMNHHREYFDAA